MTRTAAAPPAATFTFRDYFARLFEHDRWANGLVLSAMTGLGETLPPKPLGRLSHLIICQQLWLSRLADEFDKPASIFPTWTLAETRERYETIGGGMKQFIEMLPDADFHAHFDFTSMEGKPYRLLRRDILTQLAEHGAYHRGQIAVEINPLLDAPLATDYVFWAWESRERA